MCKPEPESSLKKVKINTFYEVLVIVLKVEKDINLCTYITRWSDYFMPGLIGLIAWQNENLCCQLCRPHLPFWSQLTANQTGVGLWHNNSLLMTWYGLFRVLVQIRNNGQSTTLEQCEIMWDTWDWTASSFPAESRVNITKQIRNDFFHVGRCRFAFFSPVLVISTVFPADITRVVKYGKNWLETRCSWRLDSIPSQSDTHHHSRHRQEEGSKDNLSEVNDDLRVQYKLNKDYFRDTGDRGRSQSKQMMTKTENGLKTQKPKVRSDKRRSRSRSLIRKRGVG